MYRIRVDASVFEGDSNVYVFGHAEDDAPLTLVDTGINTQTALAQVRAGLDEYSVSISDVDQVVLTHFHYDHAGLAAEIQEESSATIYCHDLDAPFVASTAEGLGERYAAQADRLSSWDLPAERREEVISFLTESAVLAGDAVDVTPISDGTTIQVGSEGLTAIHLPGHTAGHIGLRSSSNELLAGDVVLPTYTPNVGGGDLRVDRPLEQFLESLDTVEAAAFDRIHPGHGDPIDDPGQRIDALRRHHDRRARRVCESLTAAESATPWIVAQELFGELSGIHLLHGVGEAAAHLQWLETLGYVERIDRAYTNLAKLPPDSLLRTTDNERPTNPDDASLTDR